MTTSVVSKCLVQPVLLTTGDVNYYQAPANTRVMIDKCTATNTTGGAITVTFNLVQAAGSASATNTVISATSIAAGGTYLCPEVSGHTLNPADFISAKASAGASIGIRVSGREVS